mgnify:FL=1
MAARDPGDVDDLGFVQFVKVDRRLAALVAFVEIGYRAFDQGIGTEIR